MAKVKDLAGLTFGRLLVTARAGSTARGQALWLCRCECGQEKIIRGFALTEGTTASCGCLHREICAETMRRMATTHGQARPNAKTPEYHAWLSMVSRCTDPRSDCWDRYGGRGITVCERWKDSFEAFFADMGQRPSPKHSLDRVDNDRGYCPENCRWATMKEQNRNKRNSLFLSFNGQTKTLAEWAELLGIRFNTLHERLRRGWPVNRALTVPVRPLRRLAGEELSK